MHLVANCRLKTNRLTHHRAAPKANLSRSSSWLSCSSTRKPSAPSHHAAPAHNNNNNHHYHQLNITAHSQHRSIHSIKGSRYSIGTHPLKSNLRARFVHPITSGISFFRNHNQSKINQKNNNNHNNNNNNHIFTTQLRSFHQSPRTSCVRVESLYSDIEANLASPFGSELPEPSPEEMLRMQHWRFRDVELPIYDLSAGPDQQPSESIMVNRRIFQAPIRTDVLHRVVVWQLARRRAGTASGKSRGEVRGGGKKPWQQKGSGRARAGSNRSPLWVGGGVAFPPKPKSWDYPLPKAIRKMALKIALSARLMQDRLVVVNNTEIDTHKTKEFLDLAKKWSWQDGALIITGASVDNNLRLASSNLKKVDVLPQSGLNVYDILSRPRLVLDRQSLEYIHTQLELPDFNQ